MTVLEKNDHKNPHIGRIYCHSEVIHLTHFAVWSIILGPQLCLKNMWNRKIWVKVANSCQQVTAHLRFPLNFVQATSQQHASPCKKNVWPGRIIDSVFRGVLMWYFKSYNVQYSALKLVVHPKMEYISWCRKSTSEDYDVLQISVKFLLNFLHSISVKFLTLYFC